MDQQLQRADPGAPCVQHEHRIRRPPARCHDAERHKRVHGRGAVPGSPERRGMERPRRPPCNRHGQRSQHPLPAGEAERREQRQLDRQVAQRHEKHQGNDQPPAQIIHPVGVRPRLRNLGLLRISKGRQRVSRVPGLFHCLDEALQRHRRRCSHGRLLGGEIHRSRDSRKLAQFALHASSAGRACHSADRERDFG